MEFGITKCGVAVLKWGKLCKSEGIKLINGLTIKEVDDEGYIKVPGHSRVGQV